MSIKSASNSGVPFESFDASLWFSQLTIREPVSPDLVANPLCTIHQSLQPHCLMAGKDRAQQWMDGSITGLVTEGVSLVGGRSKRLLRNRDP